MDILLDIASSSEIMNEVVINESLQDVVNEFIGINSSNGTSEFIGINSSNGTSESPQSVIDESLQNIIDEKFQIVIDESFQNVGDEFPKIAICNPEKNPKYVNIVLSGGSTKGIAHIGALKKLIDSNLLDLKKIRGLASTSAGSLLGILVVLGFDIDAIWSFIKNIDFNKLISPNPILFIENCGCGMDTGEKIESIIKDILYRVTGDANISFKNLYEITHISYTVVGSCLTTKEAVYFNHINYPDFPVYLGVRISMGIPGLFTPIILPENNNKYIDGVMTDNYPIELFHDELDKTIGILICNDYNTDYKYPEEYFQAIMNLFFYMAYKKDHDKYKENTIYIKKNVSDVSIFNFNVDISKKIILYESGMAAAEEFINNLF
jgi:NTE family protein